MYCPNGERFIAACVGASRIACGPTAKLIVYGLTRPGLQSILQAATIEEGPPWTPDQLAGLAFGVSFHKAAIVLTSMKGF